MASRTGGLRRKSRYKFKKERRQKGKISLSKFMQSLKVGQRVNLAAEPAYQKGLFHARFVGRTGIVTGQRGDCYEVAINDNGKDKMLVIHPVHLKVSRG